MSSVNIVNYQYGLNCIITSVKNYEEVHLRFVIERKQYTVTYIERKQHFDDRDLLLMLKGAEAVKASIWNVPFGPPGSNKRSWYVTDIWTPNIEGMEKKRIPEPTIAIVCKIAYNLGKEFVVCDLGKYFSRDVLVIPRSEIRSTTAPNGNSSAEIGDYLLVFALVIWEKQDNDQKARLVPLWAHWDQNFCTQNCTAHLNIVECGQDNSTLLVPEQIPCMWGIVQNVYKKSLKVYVSTICSSVSVPLNTVYQYKNTCDIMEGDWLQLWLTPKVTTQMYNHFSEVSNWVCSSCCWFGSRAKKRYETYLQFRLASSYKRHDVNWAGGSSLEKDVGAKPKSTKAAENAKGDKTSATDIIGLGKVKLIKEKSGIISTSKSDQVFHLAIMTVYGVKMSKIKNIKLKDLVDEGSELRYRLSANSDSLRAVWIGPEVVTFKNLNFMPLLTAWMKKRNLEAIVVKEMMKEITEMYETVSKSNNKEKDVDSKNSSSPEKDKDGNKSKLVDLTPKSNNKELSHMVCPSSVFAIGKGPSLNEDISPTARVLSSDLDLMYFHEKGEEDEKGCKTYSKEEEEELEKLWWSEDSEESEDELRPILKTNTESSTSEKDITEGSRGNSLGIAPTSSSKEMEMLSENEKEMRASTYQNFIMKEVFSKDKHIDSNIVLPSSSPVTHQPSAVVTKLGISNNIQVETPLYLSQTKSEKNVDLLGNESKGKAVKSIPTLVIMTELTKFLLEKGKVNSIPEAGELSAEFVAQLECAMSSSSASGITLNATNVATQTVISGPIFGKNLNIEE